MVVAVCGLSRVVPRLNNCGAWAQLLHGMWDLPRPRIEPVSPASAGRLFTTETPGKPRGYIYILFIPNFLGVFIIKECWLLLSAFSMSVETVIWVLILLLIWYIALIDFCLLN